MNLCELSFVVAASGPGLVLTASLDDQIIYQQEPDASPQKISYRFNDRETYEHVLCFEMTGKEPEHTIVNEDGIILQDRTVSVTDIAFDDIQLGHLCTQIATYHHDHNGSTDIVMDQFFGTMGCNGRVEMRFSTPVFLWLLENM